MTVVLTAGRMLATRAAKHCMFIKQTPRTSYSSTLTFRQASITQNPGFDTKLRSVRAYGLGLRVCRSGSHQSAGAVR